jgi:hypothetical protein
MTAKMNCWEFKKCGKMGTCPASTLSSADGYLGGRNAGRSCVYVTGTLCSGTIQGTFKEKEKNCLACDFFLVLKKEEGTAMNAITFMDHVRKREAGH